jgi:hypothetical protein
MEFARIKKGVNVSGDSGNPINCQPSWMDLEKFQRGQNFFVKHAAAIVLALHCSLTIGFAVSRLTESLVFNKGSDTSKKARRRYFETLVHVILWHITDVWDSDTPSLSHQSLAFVRQMHNRVAKAMNDVKESITIAGQKVHILCLKQTLYLFLFIIKVVSSEANTSVYSSMRWSLQNETSWHFIGICCFFTTCFLILFKILSY